MGETHAFEERWLDGSCLTASSFSSSSLFLLEAGTDLEGRWCSSNAMRADCCMMPDCGDARFDPDRPGRLKSPGGDVKLEVE